MKVKKNLLTGLIIAMVLLILAVFASQKINEASIAEEEETTILLTDFSTSEIETFGYTYQGQSLTFAKREEVVQSDESQASDDSATSDTEESEPETETVWYLTDDPEYKINQNTVSSMLTAFVTLQADRELTQVSPEYGLDEPTLTIWVTANDETTQWICGVANDITGTIYLQQQGQEGVYLVDSNRVSIFEKSKMDLMDTSSLTTDIVSDESSSEDTSSEPVIEE